ncbi:hypothetical protein SUGI_0119770 [Cryptomeria japonica]|nr:hypothetical protein SUGI_0119770 [Cryptomeria japonica]
MKPAPMGWVGVRRSPALKMSRLVAGHHETYILWLQKLLRNRHPAPAIMAVRIMKATKAGGRAIFYTSHGWVGGNSRAPRDGISHRWWGPHLPPPRSATPTILMDGEEPDRCN